MPDNKDLPAYPVPENVHWAYPGFSKREIVAAMCLQGIISNSEDRGTDYCARRAVELADALLTHLQNTEQ
jgi:hypothetical protein